MNPFDLTGKKAIVTGAYHGLGFGITEGLAKAGAHVMMVDIAGNLDESARKLRDLGLTVDIWICDLGSREERAACIEHAVKLFDGRLDILVNNAGIQLRHPVLEFPMEDWDKVLEMNLTSVFDLCQRSARIMEKQGKGKIINIGSVNSIVAGINTTAYCAAKGGVALLTKGMSNELSSKGINVNCIAPGYMATPLNKALLADEKRFNELTSRIPIGRWGQPEDMAGAAVFLASEASNYICGAILPVDGGFLGR